jgi:hypothetical protein
MGEKTMEREGREVMGGKDEKQNFMEGKTMEMEGREVMGGKDEIEDEKENLVKGKTMEREGRGTDDEPSILNFPLKGTYEMFSDITKDLVECGGRISPSSESIFPGEILEYDKLKESRCSRRSVLDIKKSTLRCLGPGEWLNCDVIDLWCEWYVTTCCPVLL